MYRFLDHTADVQVECRGDGFPQLLAAAAQALYAVAVREASQSATEHRSITLGYDSFEDGLVRWLQELIFLLDTEGFVGTRFEFVSATADGLAVTAGGHVCRADERAEEVKSATYHGLTVLQDSDGFMARFILDL